MNQLSTQETEASVYQNPNLLVTPAILAMAAALFWLASPIPDISMASAGKVQTVLVQESTFSTSTTVVTTTGTYHVRGGVSAARGDSVSLKTELVQPYPGLKPTIRSLCVDSKIKTDCYLLTHP